MSTYLIILSQFYIWFYTIFSSYKNEIELKKYLKIPNIYIL